MRSSTKAALVGLVGVFVTVKAYDQPYVNPTIALLIGLGILVLGLGVKEGYFF